VALRTPADPASNGFALALLAIHRHRSAGRGARDALRHVVIMR
jgi:hypothetical protein